MYDMLDGDVLDERLYEFSELLYYYLSHDKISQEYVNEVQYELDDIGCVLERINQRDHYYRTFHDMEKGMSEVKSYALLCFWLLKYRPVQPVLRERAGREKIPSSQERQAYNDARAYFTERFCLYMLDGLSAAYNGYVLPVSDSYRQELAYNLRNADISKEALIMLFEALVPVSYPPPHTQQGPPDCSGGLFTRFGYSQYSPCRRTVMLAIWLRCSASFAPICPALVPP